VEEIVAWLSQLDMLYIYAAVLGIAYIENIFPPFPSDVIVVFAGSLIAIGKGSAIITVLLATAGSTAGFLTMYWIGVQFGDRVLETGRIRFITPGMLRSVHAWFGKYGYGVIVANRFMAGTRAVISFAAGVNDMKLVPTTFLSTVSAFIWNVILVYLGFEVGDNWRIIGEYLSTYSTVATIAIAVVGVSWAGIAYLRSRHARKKPHQ
jgi:membrane protein DedA with SNARE-associated domain